MADIATLSNAPVSRREFRGHVDPRVSAMTNSATRTPVIGG
ncbi:hypothetical protein [Nonomuraea cypriaca]|nr:hypothetical protein [Nonomuraea cypriaca]